MSETTEQSGRERSVIYIVAVVVLVALTVIALLAFRAGRENEAAQEQATQLAQALEDAGLRAPSTEQIVRVLGDDGGAVCENPNGALTRGLVLNELTNGAAGPGRRPILVEDRVLRSQLLIIGVYCPDELPNYEKFVDRLETVNGS
jgi:Tfp pilus assembly protein FimT